MSSSSEPSIAQIDKAVNIRAGGIELCRGELDCLDGDTLVIGIW